MKLTRLITQCALGGFIVAAIVACGGGGGSSTPVTLTPSVALSANTAQLPQGSSIVFSCGCTAQAGTVNVGAGGAIAIAATTAATPASPSPTYTIVPGRNYVVVGTSPTQLQQWTVAFVGNSSATNLYLGSSPAIDNYSTLAALYIYFNSPDALAAQSSNVATFDDWNFNSVSAWVTSMRNGSRTAAETQALADIASSQGSGTVLYPQAPNWNLTQSANTTIANDLTAIANAGTAADATLPTPCPINGTSVACTGAPSP